MLRPDIRAKHARANHCSVKHELLADAPAGSATVSSCEVGRVRCEFIRLYLTDHSPTHKLSDLE